jgi:UDP-galactopyranose mutase
MNHYKETKKLLNIMDGERNKVLLNTYNMKSDWHDQTQNKVHIYGNTIVHTNIQEKKINERLTVNVSTHDAKQI